jgi:hypothetical protein
MSEETSRGKYGGDAGISLWHDGFRETERESEAPEYLHIGHFVDIEKNVSDFRDRTIGAAQMCNMDKNDFIFGV